MVLPKLFSKAVFKVKPSDALHTTYFKVRGGKDYIELKEQGKPYEIEESLDCDTTYTLERTGGFFGKKKVIAYADRVNYFLVIIDPDDGTKWNISTVEKTEFEEC